MDEASITIFAHRGMHLGGFDKYGNPLIENTARAFDRALRYGFHAVECDLMSLKCGTVIVCHDENLKRLSGADKNISDLTLNELAEAFPSAMTFKDFHRKFRNLPVTVNLEVKDSVDTLSAIVPYLHDFANIVISSFKHEITDAAKALGFESAYLFATASDFYNAPEKHSMRCHLPAWPADIDAYKKQGLPETGEKLYYYTVNGLKQLNTLAKLPRFGGFFTDNIEFSPLFSAEFSLAVNEQPAVY